MPPPPSERLSCREIARQLVVALRTVHRWADRGIRGHKLPCFRIGNKRYSTKADLDAFLAAINGPAQPQG